MSDDSALSLVAQVEQETEAMLRACREEVEDIRRAAMEEAAELLASERRRMEEAEREEEEAIRAESEARRRESLAAATAELEELEKRAAARSPEAVRTVMEIVLGGGAS